MTTKLSAMTSALVLLSGISMNAQAQGYAPGYTPYAPANPAYRMPNQGPVPYRIPSYNRAPAAQGNRAPAPYNRAPMPNNAYNPYRGPSRSTPWGGNNMPWSGNNLPWSGNRMPGPWGNRGWGNNNRRGPIPFESNFTPWSVRFWDELGDGGKNPLKDMGDWFDPSEPREGMGDMWDDLLNAPADMGKMPGGWTAPSVSVPNPVDVQKEFEDTAKDMPDEARTQMDNIDINMW